MTANFLSWFFAKAPIQILQIGRNFLLWAWHFFSIGYFLPSLLSPWHRDITGYGRGFDLKRFLQVLGWNLISRVIGGVMRLVVLVFGLFVELVLVFFIFLVFGVWIFIPLLIPVLIILGILTFLL